TRTTLGARICMRESERISAGLTPTGSEPAFGLLSIIGGGIDGRLPASIHLVTFRRKTLHGEHIPSRGVRQQHRDVLRLTAQTTRTGTTTKGCNMGSEVLNEAESALRESAAGTARTHEE